MPFLQIKDSLRSIKDAKLYLTAIPLEITSLSAGKDADCHLLSPQPLKWETQLKKNSSALS